MINKGYDTTLFNHIYLPAPLCTIVERQISEKVVGASHSAHGRHYGAIPSGRTVFVEVRKLEN